MTDTKLPPEPSLAVRMASLEALVGLYIALDPRRDTFLHTIRGILRDQAADGTLSPSLIGRIHDLIKTIETRNQNTKGP